MFTKRSSWQRLLPSRVVALALAGATLMIVGSADGVGASFHSVYGQAVGGSAFVEPASAGSSTGIDSPIAAPARAWTAHKPEELNRLFVKAVNEGNVDAVVGLFEADAKLAPQPGATPVQGEAALRAVIEGWVALQLKFESSSREAIQNGDLVLLRGPWQVTLTGPDGQTLTQNGHGLEIARRQPDGSWRYVLAVGGG